MPKPDIWNSHWMEIAFVTSKLSKDPSTKVGAVLVSQDNSQCSVGYNGMPRSYDEEPDDWLIKDRKYNLVFHAEDNCILNCPFSMKGCKLYCTHKPCYRCMERILHVGITEVYFKIDYDKLGFEDIWNKCASKIKIQKIV
jgi:dCMP deaminase